jgi:hypothetical protein
VNQGRSLLKLGAPGSPSWRKDWLYDYYEYPGWENVKPHRGVRTETHKLIQWCTQDPEEWELYDLASDPNEPGTFSAYRSMPPYSSSSCSGWVPLCARLPYALPSKAIESRVTLALLCLLIRKRLHHILPNRLHSGH